jgi:hypothetical protein
MTYKVRGSVVTLTLTSDEINEVIEALQLVSADGSVVLCSRGIWSEPNSSAALECAFAPRTHSR